MKKIYDLYTLQQLCSMTGAMTVINGKWVPAKPEPYYSLLNRLKLAWLVLTYKADAFQWYKQ